LSLIIGFSSSLAIPMGLITMIFYLIPMFGQFIGGTLVTVVLFFSSPIAALVFAIIYILYAQIENNIIAPKIQGDALHLSAVIILSAITIGMYMMGLLGAIVAIPIAGCIRVLVDEYPNIKAAKG
jgi:predicted PurR-regulated permease PerM